MKRRVTLRQIAARAGVHLSTVSLALRNDIRLPEETRTRLRTLADEMGYVPDAAMSALCSYRSSIRPHEVQSGLAYLTDEPSDRYPLSALVYKHARAQATKLGYNLIEYHLTKKGPSLERLQSIWWSTGLRGVLVGPFRTPGTTLEVSWDRWPTVAFGHSIAAPQFNRAVFNHFQNMLILLDALRSRGYRRMGVCLPSSFHGGLSDRTQGLLHAACLLDQARNARKSKVTILKDGDVPDDAFDAWVRREKFDVVIGYAERYFALKERGWRIPDEIGFAMLSIYNEPRGPKLAGFDTKVEALAATAIHFLVSLIHEQAHGLLNPPRSHMVSGEFRDGITVRPAGGIESSRRSRR